MQTITIGCSCCEHRNPVGAKFCNACGAALHLKPCTRCEAISARAAAHCHRCGEAFTFDFAAMDVSSTDDAGADVRLAPVASPGPFPERSSALVGRVVALVALITAMVLLPAYLSHTAQDQALVDAGTGSQLQHAGAPVEEEIAPKRSGVAAVPEPEATGQVGELASVGSAPAAATLGTIAGPGASGPAVLANAAVFHPTGRTQPERQLSRSTNRETHSWTSKDRRGAASRPQGRKNALQQPAVTATARAATGRGRATSSRVSASAVPPDTLQGQWQRPCAEGRPIEAGCDVRLLPKGN